MAYIESNKNKIRYTREDASAPASWPRYATVVVEARIVSTNGILDLQPDVTLEFTGGGTIHNITTINAQRLTLVVPPDFCITSGNFFPTFTSALNNTILSPHWFVDPNRSLLSYSWSDPIQYTLNLAALSGGTVQLEAFHYQNIVSPILIPAGVTLQGAGNGETMFGNGPTRGTILQIAGFMPSPYHAGVVMNGRLSKLKDLSVKNVNGSGQSTSIGILVNGVRETGDATNRGLLEQVHIENVNIHTILGEDNSGVMPFRHVGLYLRAGNGGSITYSTFKNIRTRNCNFHIVVECLSSDPIFGNTTYAGVPFDEPTGFINSNSFENIYMSGFAKCGLSIETQADAIQVNSRDVYRPANNLTFTNVVIEPPSAELGHVRVLGGGSQIRMYDARIEGLQQDSLFPNVPILFLDENTQDSVIEFDQASITMLDKGRNNRIHSKSTKYAAPYQQTFNLYNNSALIGRILATVGEPPNNFDEVRIPGWTLQEQYVGSGTQYPWRTLRASSPVQVVYQTGTPYQGGYKVLNVTVPPQYQFRMVQDLDRTFYRLKTAKVNFIVKATNNKDITVTYQDSLTPLLSLGTNLAITPNDWQPIGGMIDVRPDASFYRLALFCQNLQDEITGSNIVFDVTKPTLVQGEETPFEAARPITQNGGILFAPLGQHTVDGLNPSVDTTIQGVGGPTDVVLPLEAGHFNFIGSNYSIQKINADVSRFPTGATIVCTFDGDGISLIDSGFINLVKPFRSEVGSSISLKHNGNGTWRELFRFSPNTQGFQTLDIINDSIFNSGNGELTLPVNGNNIFEITNLTSASVTISRINNLLRLPAGTFTLVRFNNPGSIAINSNAFIELTSAAQYIPQNGQWIMFYSTGDGVTREVLRKPVSGTFQTSGYTLVDLNTNPPVSTELTLTPTSSNYFLISNTSASGQTIARINNLLANRFAPGAVIHLEFGTLTNSVTISTTGGFIQLSSLATTYQPVQGDWITFITSGNGTWREIDRKPSVFPVQTKGLADVTLDASNPTSNQLILSTTGANFFRINAATHGGTIQRINNTAGTRFAAGTVITLKFTNVTASPTLVDSAFIFLEGGVNYTPLINQSITLITPGDGTWEEVSRRS